MDYIKIRLGRGLHPLPTELGRTLESLFRSMGPVGQAQGTWKPQMDIFESPEELVLIAETAGVRREDLEVEMDQGAMRVAGVRKEPARQGGVRYHLAEIPFGRFERIIRLPQNIDPEAVTAAYKDGLLVVRMPKKQPPMPRQVDVAGE